MKTTKQWVNVCFILSYFIFQHRKIILDYSSLTVVPIDHRNQQSYRNKNWIEMLLLLLLVPQSVVRKAAVDILRTQQEHPQPFQATSDEFVQGKYSNLLENDTAHLNSPGLPASGQCSSHCRQERTCRFSLRMFKARREGAWEGEKRSNSLIGSRDPWK